MMGTTGWQSIHKRYGSLGHLIRSQQWDGVMTPIPIRMTYERMSIPWLDQCLTASEGRTPSNIEAIEASAKLELLRDMGCMPEMGTTDQQESAQKGKHSTEIMFIDLKTKMKQAKEFA